MVVGQDRSGTGRDLVRFFEDGTREVVRFGVELQQIVGSDRLLDRCLAASFMPTA